MFRFLSVALALAIPLSIHWSVTRGYMALAASISAMLCLAMLWNVLRPSLRVPAALLSAASCWLFYANQDAAFGATALLPTLMYVLMAVFFGRTLRPGQIPTVTRIAAIERGELDAELRAYTRSVTAVWCVFFMTMALVSLSLAWFASETYWSWFTNVLSLPLMLGLFAAEYAYRRVRLRHHPHSNPVRLAMAIARRAPELLR